MTTIITQEQGYAGLSNKIPRIVTQSTLSQVTTAGWYNNTQVASGQPGLNPQDLVVICYSYASASQNTSIFNVNIGAKGIVTLSLVDFNDSGVNANVVTVTSTALASAGKVNIFTAPTPTAQIALLDWKVFKSTGLSGGGDRLLSLTDGTLVFNNAGITAALLETPIFTLLGGTGNPIASSSEATISTAGADVFLQYIGGTTDYTAGSVIVAVSYARVTI